MVDSSIFSNVYMYPNLLSKKNYFNLTNNLVDNCHGAPSWWFWLLWQEVEEEEEAKAVMEVASLLMASTKPLIPCLFISAFDSSISSLLSCSLTTSLCLLSCLSSLSLITWAIRDALLDNAVPTATSSASLSPPPAVSPLVVLFRFACDVSEYSLVLESELQATTTTSHSNV